MFSYARALPLIDESADIVFMVATLYLIEDWQRVSLPRGAAFCGQEVDY